MRWFCNNEYDHRRQAQRDFDRGRPDRDHYDRHSFDECNRVYAEEYDRLRCEEDRRESARQEEAEQHAYAERARQHRAHEERLQEDAYYAEMERQHYAEMERHQPEPQEGDNAQA